MPCMEWFLVWRPPTRVMAESPDSDVREPRLVRRSTTAVRAKLCPRCLNPLKLEGNLLGYLAPQKYLCTSCGYRGPVFVESDQGIATGDKKDSS